MPNLEVVRYSLETAMSNATSMTHRSLHQNRFHTHNQLSSELLSYVRSGVTWQCGFAIDAKIILKIFRCDIYGKFILASRLSVVSGGQFE